MYRWFSRDKNGHLGVFDAEDIVPEVAGDRMRWRERASRDSEDGLDLTFAISRMLRVENRPLRGVHARVRGGTLQMIASAANVRRFAERVETVETVADEFMVASFAPPRRGRDAAFMPGIRTFGVDESDELSPLERAHAAGLCGGCAIDRADDDIADDGLQELGVFVYECDEQLETLHRVRVPSTPLVAARVGELATRCLRYDGQFATTDELPMAALKPPSRT